MSGATYQAIAWALLALAIVVLVAYASPSQRARMGRKGAESAVTVATASLLFLWFTGGLDRALFAASRPALPEAQRRLLQQYDRHAEEWERRTNELAREPVRAERAAALCAEGGPPAAENWIGRVVSVRTGSLSDTVSVKLRLSERVTVRTFGGNPLTEPARVTDVSRTDPLLPAIAALREGDAVRFSAQFLPDARDCIAEGSLTQRGGMREPELLMRLTAIGPAR